MTDCCKRFRGEPTFSAKSEELRLNPRRIQVVGAENPFDALASMPNSLCRLCSRFLVGSDERVVSSRNRRNPRCVKRKMSNFPLHPRHVNSLPKIDIRKAIRIVTEARII